MRGGSKYGDAARNPSWPEESRIQEKATFPRLLVGTGLANEIIFDWFDRPETLRFDSELRSIAAHESDGSRCTIASEVPV